MNSAPELYCRSGAVVSNGKVGTALSLSRRRVMNRSKLFVFLAWSTLALLPWINSAACADDRGDVVIDSNKLARAGLQTLWSNHAEVHPVDGLRFALLHVSN